MDDAANSLQHNQTDHCACDTALNITVNKTITLSGNNSKLQNNLLTNGQMHKSKLVVVLTTQCKLQ